MQEKGFLKEDTDFVKFFAVLMLLFHHAYLYNPYAESADIFYQPFSRAAVLEAAVLCRSCILVFAMLSGYGLYVTYQCHCTAGSGSCWNFIGSRLVRMMKNYWLIYGLVTILYLVVPSSGISASAYGSWQAVLANATGTAFLFRLPLVCDPWWYMSFIIVFILLVPAFAWLCDHGGILIFLGLFVLVSGNWMDSYLLDYYLSPLLAAFTGMLCARWKVFDFLHQRQIGGLKGKPLSLCKIAAVLLLGLLAVLLRQRGFLSRSIGTVLSFLMIVLLNELSGLIPPNGRTWICRMGGCHSENMYLIHYFWLTTAAAPLIYSLHHFLLIIAAVYFLSWAASVLLNRGLKRLPSLKRISQ